MVVAAVEPGQSFAGPVAAAGVAAVEHRLVTDSLDRDFHPNQAAHWLRLAHCCREPEWPSLAAVVELLLDNFLVHHCRLVAVVVVAAAVEVVLEVLEDY